MAIVEKNGRITPDDFAAVLKAKMNPQRLWTNELLMLKKIEQGMNPWWETGRGNIPAGCATMAIAPVGVINAGDPAQAYQDAFCIASINQDGSNRDCAATYAAGVAAAFSPGATVETVIAAMFDHSDYLTKRSLTLAMDMARGCADVDEFAQRFYGSAMMDWSWPQQNWKPQMYFCGNSIEFLPVVPAIISLCNGEPNASIIEGASFGRDCDTIASCIGCIVGALHGAAAMRPEWIEESERANADVFTELHGDPGQNFSAMARRMVDALRGEQRRIDGRACLAAQILGD